MDKSITRRIIAAVQLYLTILSETTHGGSFDIQAKFITICIAEDKDKPNAEEPLYYNCINTDPETASIAELVYDLDEFIEVAQKLIQEENPKYQPNA